MDLETMTIAEHEAEINRLSDQRRTISGAMQAVHDSMERKMRATPQPIPTPGDQNIMAGPVDLNAFVRNLGKDAIAELKKLLKGDD